MRESPVLLKTLAVLTPAVAAARTDAQTFTGLGFLQGGASSQAWAVSADGSVVVGRSSGADGYFRAFRWDHQSGMMGLGVLPGAIDSFGRGVSADGSVVVGQSSVPAGPSAFRWTAATGMVALPVGPGGGALEAVAISADGLVVVGNEDRVSLRWEGASVINLGDPPGLSPTATCEGISTDGTHAVGSIRPGSTGPERYAFQWTSATGMTPLGGLQSSYSIAYGTNADGSVIVGVSSGESNPIGAFRWTSTHGVEALGGSASAARGVSADGRVVVGISGNSAMMWTQDLGMVNLNVYLPSIGIDLAGWTLSIAMAVSADGLTIVGTGVHNGLTEAWAATLGCYANCDNSTGAPVLNILDFLCFVNRFATGEARANCDVSTTPPVLNVNDFVCFLNRFTTGCS